MMGGYGSAPRSNDLGPAGHIPVATSADAAPATCQVCGTVLIDEFDKVIGLCDTHQKDRRSVDGESMAAPVSASGVGAQWHARSPDGLVSGPMTLEELRSRIRSGSFAATDDFSRDGVDFGPIARFKELAYLASLTSDHPAGHPYSGPSFVTGGSDLNLGRLVTPLLLLMIIGGVGYLGYSKRAELSRLVAGLTSSASEGRPKGPNPLQRYRDGWFQANPDVSGTAAEYLVTAKARHLENTWRGYQQAERAFPAGAHPR